MRVCAPIIIQIKILPFPFNSCYKRIYFCFMCLIYDGFIDPVNISCEVQIQITSFICFAVENLYDSKYGVKRMMIWMDLSMGYVILIFSSFHLRYFNRRVLLATHIPFCAWFGDQMCSLLFLKLLSCKRGWITVFPYQYFEILSDTQFL